MKHLFAACAACATVALCLPAAAQNLKPGLWEITTRMQSGSGQVEQALAKAQQQMAALPPEQRKMMEEMMAKRGVKMGPGGPDGGMNLSVCMTKDMVERNQLPAQQGDCKTTSQQRTGNTMKVAFSCANPPSSGEGEVTFVSSEAYTQKMVVNTTVKGKAEKLDMNGSGKWLGADCGSVKPLGGAAQK